MNIYDIAEKCGVSIATVSRVLNNNAHVNPQTRDRILAAMAEAGYTPNAFARGLGAGASRTVVVLCFDLRAPLTAELVTALEPRLQEQGRMMILRSAASEDFGAHLSAIAAIHPEALILPDAVLTPDGEAALTAFAAHTTVILLNSGRVVPGCYRVSDDADCRMHDLLTQLVARHRQHVLLLHTADSPLPDATASLIAAYTDGMNRIGIAPAAIAVEPTPDAVNAEIKHLLVQRVSFDAIIGADDRLAIWAQRALQRIGLTMPVIGFGNSALTRCSTPELTSVDYHPTQVADAATELLECRSRNEEVPSSVTVPTALIERDSFRL